MNFEAQVSIVMAVLLGLLVGSFLNVVIYRLPLMLEKQWQVLAKQHLDLPLTEEERQPFNLMFPPSRCPECGTGVKPWQNIPLLSYLLLRGRCHHCRTPIGWRYPAVELLTGVLFGVVAWQYGVSGVTLGGLLLTAMLIAMTFIDADTQLLPDQLTLPLIWLGLLFNWQFGFVSLPQALLGAVCGYMSLWLLFHLFKLLTGKDGMGYGDFKLLAALGAWLGVGSLPVIVFMAALVGLVAALVMKAAKGQPIAFGPALAIAGWIVFVANDVVKQGMDWWLSKSGFI
ncbi:prepilin peptidase [Neisseria shayeganii]|uniref:Prepilin leader peptidase/N-methyltransferase n=1 Tax=Neisseria shayeganii 871 TaxID=1032488 RepID=G4CKC7_9NEIS|nr:A24 family peptidase [Neisseria shayeganii]EGY51718.1 leader peptidase (prepilin peptidase)/N-methyltransferase [Neisseria shayeganii 871]